MYGSAGTMARPVMVGPHAFTRGFAALANAFFACFTAVWIVKAGRALSMIMNAMRQEEMGTNIHGCNGLECSSFDGYHAHSCGLGKVCGFEGRWSSSVGLIRLERDISAMREV
jgi:hypothetical protein